MLGVVGRDGGYTKQVADACVLIPTVNDSTITPHSEAFQGVVWHLLVSHPKLKQTQTKWESAERSDVLEAREPSSSIATACSMPRSCATASRIRRRAPRRWRSCRACAEALDRRLRAAGAVALVVVTNQPDVARGKQTRAAVDAIHAKLRAELPLDAIYTHACHDDADACSLPQAEAGPARDPPPQTSAST